MSTYNVKMNVSYCAALSTDRYKCMKEPERGSFYCANHIYFEKFSPEELNLIINVNDSKNVNVCKKCRKWHISSKKTCSACSNKNKEYMAKIIETRPERKCEWYVKNFDRCTHYKMGKSLYCEGHTYVEEYSSQMKELVNLHYFECCDKVRYKSEKCLHCALVREKRKIATGCNETCKYEGNNGQCKNVMKENGYCGKHKLCHWVESIRKKGLRPCSNYKRGCRSELLRDYKYKKCGDCLEKDRRKYNDDL
jgi:hypothetical protein